MVYNGGQLGIVAFIEAKFKLTSAVKFIVVNMILADVCMSIHSLYNIVAHL